MSADDVRPEPPLEKELVFFDARRAAWLAEGLEGRWMVVVGERLVGDYAGFEEAYNAGLEVAGVETPFLVKQLFTQDPSYQMPLLTTGIRRAEP